MSAKPLLLVALESEVPVNITERWNVVFTGVGKINASYALMKALTSYRPSLLINYGTAGGITPQTKKCYRLVRYCNVIWMCARLALHLAAPLLIAALPVSSCQPAPRFRPVPGFQIVW